jgi:hypothetical protein
MSTYGELLKDPRWQKKRLEIFTRDIWMCRYCYSKDKTLHVHHLLYRYGCLPWDYEDDVFITLCEGCHDTEGFYKRENPMLAAYATRAKLMVLELHDVFSSAAYLKETNPDGFKELNALIKRMCKGGEYVEYIKTTLFNG